MNSTRGLALIGMLVMTTTVVTADDPPCHSMAEQLVCMVLALGDEKECVGFMTPMSDPLFPAVAAKSGAMPFLDSDSGGVQTGLLIARDGGDLQHLPHHFDYVLFGGSTRSSDCQEPLNTDDQGLSEYWISIIERALDSV